MKPFNTSIASKAPITLGRKYFCGSEAFSGSKIFRLGSGFDMYLAKHCSNHAYSLAGCYGMFPREELFVGCMEQLVDPPSVYEHNGT